jgi:hypothetical protein
MKWNIAWLVLGSVFLISSGALQACGEDEVSGNLDSGILEGGSSNGGSGNGGEGDTANGATGGGNNGVSTLGQACDSDADCDGLTCLDADSDVIGGGPAHGVCTMDCSDDAVACGTLAPGAVCVTFDQAGTIAYCFEGCDFGDVPKCHDRIEMACSPLNGQFGVIPACMPQCNADDDCPSNRACDRVAGTCVDAAPEGLGVGETCDPEAEERECRGLCLSWVDDEDMIVSSTCTEFCTIGALPACGFDGVTGDPVVCGFFAQGVTGGGVGDAGMCTKLCDCDSDCGGTESCVPFGGANPPFGKDGYCTLVNPGTETLDCDMGSGGTGGAGGSASSSGGSGGGGGAGGSN